MFLPIAKAGFVLYETAFILPDKYHHDEYTYSSYTVYCISISRWVAPTMQHGHDLVLAA